MRWTPPRGVKLLAVLGHPIRHSISPQMHHAALHELAQVDPSFANWRYLRIEVPPERLPGALPLLYIKGFQGINLTIPHKVDVLSLTKWVEPHPDAQQMGAVNTLLREGHRFLGFNTDGDGMDTAILEALGIELTGQRIVLLGAGGAARAAAVQCLNRACAQLWLGNRSPERLDALIVRLKPIAESSQLHSFCFDAWPQTATLLNKTADPLLIINATAAGLKSEDLPPVDLSLLKIPFALFDMIYNPPITPLMRAAQSLDQPAVNGLDMLIYQGKFALDLWTDLDTSAELMRQAAQEALRA